MIMNDEHEAYLKKQKRQRIKISIWRVAILIGLIALWEIAAMLKWIDPFLTSSPSRIVKSLVEFIKGGTLFTHIWVTCYETIVGFLLGTIIGILFASAYLSISNIVSLTGNTSLRTRLYHRLFKKCKKIRKGTIL